eukprot:3715813-Prymnesium_polylepis.1
MSRAAGSWSRDPESSAVPAADMETMLHPRPAQLTAAATCRLAKRTSLGASCRQWYGFRGSPFTKKRASWTDSAYHETASARRER